MIRKNSYLMTATYDDILERITAPTLTTENWEGILGYCDKINADNLEGAKTALKALRKRLNNRDPHVVLLAISVLDSSWSNCGLKFRKEVSSSQFINELKALCTNSQRQVSEKMRVSLQKWVESECKSEPSLSLITSLYKELKSDGYSFTVEDPIKKSISAANAKYANDPNFVGSAQEEEEIAKAIAASLADAEKQEKMKKSTTASLYPTALPVSSSDSKVGQQSERKVRALYDFEAAENNELSFVAGDMIVVIDESNPHWWTGRVGGRQGLFPSSFVSTNLEDAKAKEDASQKTPEVVASINEAILVRCLNVLHECDPTGERADPPDLAQLEAASYAQGPLIDAHLASIDRQSNSLAQVDIAIRDVLALYDDAIQKSGGAYQAYGQQMQQQYSQQAYPQQYPQSSQQMVYPQYPPQAAPTQQQYYPAAQQQWNQGQQF